MLEFSASRVAGVAKEVASEEGIEDTDWITATWTGRTLTALRFRRGRIGKRRFFTIPLDQLRATARAYGLLRAAPRPVAGAAGDTPPASPPAGQGDAPIPGPTGAVARANPHPPESSVISGRSVIVSPPAGAADGAAAEEGEEWIL